VNKRRKRENEGKLRKWKDMMINSRDGGGLKVEIVREKLIGTIGF
jgi:hypothetical protein